ncbi:MAG: CotH kinase family protein [Verrucomicrobia bacterium]|nr:CotH kinase family protein [Verrucomicrobiota bacterium]
MSHPGKKLSRGRQWARALVWLAFAVVLTLRFVVPREREERIARAPWEGGRPGRFHRPPVQVQPPVSKVPADLWRLEIEIARKDVVKLRRYQWNGWRGEQQERPEVLVTVREGGVVYTNVALHLKGAAGSFRPFDDKPALTLHFSKHASGQRLHGYNKVSLNNSVQDPSYLSEAISRELFEAAGVPVPRADHATVLINGRDLGLYVLTEGFGKPFLKRYFKDVSGNLYDGGFVQEITGYLATNSGDHPENRSDLKRLAEATFENDRTNRWQRLSQVLDMERFLSFLAMEVMTCHWDGYALNRNNYRLFHDVETDRLVFMPHGLDQMFGVFRSTPTSPIQPSVQGLVAQAVLTTTQGARLYLERVATLRTNVFLEERLTNRVQELSRRIRPTLAAYGEHLAAEHDAHAADLCQRIVERARSISEQLAPPREPLKFDDAGVARLSGWKPRITSQQRGVLRFGRAEREGKRLLQISAVQGGGVGSWRARALLAPGRYRLEGNVRTSDVGASGGVCLRISGTRDVMLLASDGEWMPLHYSFALDEPLAEVELICELRAGKGEAWIEEDSLRLVRE